MSESLVIFSIGNPGPATRHSCGHLALSKLVSHLGAKQLAKSALFSSTKTSNITLVKSNSYMNESDKALKKFIDTAKLKFNDSSMLVILYDDFELDLGRVSISKFKKNESHNGLKCLQRMLQRENTDHVYKLGIGIGPKPQGANKDTMANWVLSPFTLNEKNALESASLPLVIDYIDYIIEVEGEVADCNKVNAYFKNAI